MNEILIDDDFWGQFYYVKIPGGGTLTAEWKSGEIETANGSGFLIDRWYGLTGSGTATRSEKRRDKCVRIYSDEAITVCELEGAWTYGFYVRQGKVHIDTNNCPSLQHFHCAKVSSLDLSENPDLSRISISYSDLAELDLSNNGKLEMLILYHCDNLEVLDLSNCPQLKLLQLCYCPALKTVILGDESALHLYEYKAVALSRESEDKILCTIERNGGYVEKIYLGDSSQW